MTPTPGFHYGAPIVNPAFASSHLAFVLAYVLRSPTVFAEAREHVVSQVFRGDGEKPYEVAWAAYCKLFDKGLAQPDPNLWKSEVASYCQADPVMFPHVLAMQSYQFIDYVYTLDQANVQQSETYIRGELHRFLSERTAVDPLRRMLNDARVGILAEPTAVIEKFTGQLSKIGSLSAPSVAFEAMPKTTLVQAAKKPTMVSAVDQATGGGVQAGKTYGLFGPVGAFKTGLGVQLCVERALGELASVNEKPTYRPGLSIYLTYEAPAEEIQGRAIACGAEIPWDRTRDILSGQLQPTAIPRAHEYERNRNDDLSEMQRFFDASRRLQFLRILDMSGRPGSEHVGKGGVPEMVSHVERIVRDTNLPIAQIVIDYAKLAANRYLHARGMKPEHLRVVLSAMPDEIRRTLAQKFGCPVWVIQQLNTIANRKAPGVVTHHSFASEDGMFGENLFFCFTMSALDKEHGHSMQLAATKTRETAGLTRPSVLRVSNGTNRLVSTEDYVIGSSGRIEDAADRTMFPGHDMHY